MYNQRVGVLMGGLSSERSVSMASGDAVLEALRGRGFHVQPIFVDRDIDMVLRQAKIDVAFIALHGRYGEDGCVQGLLECMGIPYTGSDVLSSALAMNKVKTKELLRLHNLPTAPYYVLTRDDEDNVLEVHGDFGYPVVVKPAAEGSSVGVEIAYGFEELLAACERAFCFDCEVLVERFIDGREISVAILGDRAIGSVEVDIGDGFYDYAAKYRRNDTNYYVPPRVSPERHRGILAQALKAHNALGCSGATRVDLIVSPTGNEYILEVNTLPGLTPHSLLPKVAAEAGVPFDELCEAILRGARLATIERGQRDRRVSQRRYAGDERRETGAMDHH